MYILHLDYLRNWHAYILLVWISNEYFCQLNIIDANKFRNIAHNLLTQKDLKLIVSHDFLPYLGRKVTYILFPVRREMSSISIQPI